MHETMSMLLPLAAILVGAKIAAQISTRFGLPAVFGELVLGLVLGPSLLGWIRPNEIFQLLADIKEGHIVHEGTASVVYAFFIPIFFINIGLQAQVSGLVAMPLLAAVLVVIAIASKVIGCGGGALLGRIDRARSLVIGCGMISRGEVALVLAGAGLAAGLLDANLFSVLIVVTLVTTLVTPPLLRLAYAARPVAVEKIEPALAGD